MVDIRFEDQVQKAMEEGAKKFGGIDILVRIIIIIFHKFINMKIKFLLGK